MNEQIKISRKYLRLKEKLRQVQSEIELLQKTCTHPTRTTNYKSDRGNYDPSMDRRWTEHECHDCGKFWIEE